MFIAFINLLEAVTEASKAAEESAASGNLSQNHHFKATQLAASVVPTAGIVLVAEGGNRIPFCAPENDIQVDSKSAIDRNNS